MRILVLSDNFVPEQNAPALRTFEHCKRWVEAGHAVTVITTVPNFPLGKPQAPYHNKLYQRETISGIDVVRVWTFLAPNRGIALRSLDFISFAATGFVAGLFQRRADVILATSPQLLTAVAGRVLAAVKWTPWVMEVRDLWPDSIVAVGAMHEGRLISFLRKVERMLYRSAARVVVLNEPTRERIASRDIPIEKIGIVSNGADISRITPRAKDAPLIAEHALEGKFVAGYVGTHGMAQGLEVVVRAAELLRKEPFHFLMVGAGAQHARVMALAKRLKLDNITFVGMVPSDKALDYLSVCDAVLAPLKRTPLIDLTVPSKIFEAAAMERPTILCAHGITADLLRDYQAGIAVEPENPTALADALRALRDHPERVEQLKNGCRRLARDFDREVLAAKMLEQLSLAAKR